MLRRGILGVCGLASGLMGGCYGNFDSFAERKAHLECVRLKKCDGDTFQNVYDGKAERCRDDREDAWQDFDTIASAAGLEYDPEEGRICIEQAWNNRRVCGSEAERDINEACLVINIWD